MSAYEQGANILLEQEQELNKTIAETEQNIEGFKEKADELQKDKTIKFKIDFDTGDFDIEFGDKMRASQTVAEFEAINKGLEDIKQNIQGLDAEAGTGFESIGKFAKDLKDFLDIDKQLDDARKAMTAAGLSAEEIKEKLAELETQLKTKFIVNTMSFAMNLTEDVYNAVDDISAKMTEGDAAGATEAIGDVTTKIGKALLEAPYPLNIAGGVILGVGLVSKFIGKIMAMFQKAEKNALELAQDRARAEKNIIDGYNQQIDAMQTLVDLGNKALDTAKERAEYESRAGASLAQSGLLPSDIQEWEDEGVVAYQQQLQREKLSIEEDLATAQWMLDNGSKSQIGDFLRSRGLSDKGNNASRLAEYIQARQALLTDTESKLGAVGAEIGRRTGIQEATGIGGEVFQEEQQRLEDSANRFKQLYEDTLGKDENKAQEFYDLAMSALMERENKARLELIKSLESIPQTDADFIQKVKDAGLYEDYLRIGEMSKDELEEFYANLQYRTDEIGEETASLFDNWINSFEQMNAEMESSVDSRLRQLEYERQVLEAQLEKDEITQQEYTDRMVANYKEVLKIQQEQLAEQQAQGDSATEILDTKSEILNTEMEIWRLLNAQNKEEDTALQKMIKRRQEAVKLARATGDYSGITQMDSAIETHLRAQGKSEEYIQEFLNSLPKFAKGGKVDETGMALVHKNEVIIPESLTRQFGISGLDDLQKMYYNNYSDGARALSAPSIFNNVNNWNLNLQLNVNNNIDKIDKNNMDAWSGKISAQMEKQMVQVINNQLMNNKIDLRNSTGV